MKNLNSRNWFKKSSKTHGISEANQNTRRLKDKTYKYWFSGLYILNVAKKIIMKKESFSLMKKGFFKFGLEIILVSFVLVSVGVNALAGSHQFQTGKNRYLAFLANHPDLNENIIEKLKSENIHVTPEKLHFVLSAQAATIDSMMGLPYPKDQEDRDDSAEAQVSMLSEEDSVLIKPNLATQDANQRKDVRQYTVQNGDSVSKIASEFGVSVSTVLYENKLTENDYIKPGQQLSILPTTGIKHTVKSGETLSAIAKKYEVELEAILEFNEIQIPDDIWEGELIIIPEGKIEISESRRTEIASYSKVDVETATVPSDFSGSSGSFVWPLPTRTITQYYHSRHRAIDISNGKRPQFWAVQDGIIELSGWQGAYGRTIVINHGNGVKTRYAHASELYVTAGTKVSKGQVIGRVGNTGRTYGVTGNHLHFEVVVGGVKKNPLSYIK